MASSAAPQGQEIHRRDIQAAMAKAVELRALHAALLQGAAGSPAVQRLPPDASPSISGGSNQFSAEDYPVFTPVLEVGCGNSRLCEELLKDGVSDITCIDLSSVAVDRMRKRLSDQGIHGIKVVEADMLDLPFGSESFDLVIEKGTMAN